MVRSLGKCRCLWDNVYVNGGNGGSHKNIRSCSNSAKRVE